jgi:hypothetical protein
MHLLNRSQGVCRWFALTTKGSMQWRDIFPTYNVLGATLVPIFEIGMIRKDRYVLRSGISTNADDCCASLPTRSVSRSFGNFGWLLTIENFKYSCSGKFLRKKITLFPHRGKPSQPEEIFSPFIIPQSEFHIRWETAHPFSPSFLRGAQSHFHQAGLTVAVDRMEAESGGVIFRPQLVNRRAARYTPSYSTSPHLFAASPRDFAWHEIGTDTRPERGERLESVVVSS